MFGRWAPARQSTKRFVFVCLLRLVDGRLRAHRPNASFSAILADGRARFKPSSRGVWGAAAPQENVRTQLTEPPKTKRLVDGRAGAHRPNAIDERTSKKVFCRATRRLNRIDRYKRNTAIWYRPGMFSASAIDRLQEVAASHLGVHLGGGHDKRYVSQ